MIDSATYRPGTKQGQMWIPAGYRERNLKTNATRDKTWTALGQNRGQGDKQGQTRTSRDSQK